MIDNHVYFESAGEPDEGATSKCENAMTAERALYLLGRAMCYIGEYDRGVDFYDTLHEIIGMTDGEIAEMGFTSLPEYFREAQNDDSQEQTM